MSLTIVPPPSHRHNEQQAQAESASSMHMDTTKETLNLLDKETFMELLRTVGLPGLIIIAWLITLLLGQEQAANLMLWGSMLTGSVIVNLLVFQLSTWKDAIIIAIKGIVNKQSLQTVEILEIMMASQNSMVSNLNTLLLIEEGGLTLEQIKKLMIFYYCESLKWNTWQTIIPVLHPTLFNTEQKPSLQKTIEIHAMAVLKQLATYNKVMIRPEVKNIILKTIQEVFDQIFDPSIIKIEDYSEKIRQIIEIIRINYDSCISELDHYLSQVV